MTKTAVLACGGPKLPPNALAVMPALAMLSSLTISVAAGAQPSAASGPLLPGHWISARCEAASAAAEHSIRRGFLFTDWSWRVDVAVYQGAACALPLAGIRIEGTYALSRASPLVTTAFDATFFYTRKSAAALSDAGAAFLTAAMCGQETWRPGLEQDVSATGCIGFPAIRAECLQEFDIVAMTGGELRFGARTPNMCNAAGRPAALSPFPLVRPPGS